MSRETKDRLYQVIQYGKEKGPPVRWAGTEGSNWDEAGLDMSWENHFPFFSPSRFLYRANSHLSVGAQSCGLHFQSWNSQLVAARTFFNMAGF